MHESAYTDAAGRQWAVLLPTGASDSEASMGLPLGPPSLAELELPLETEVRLHNQLYARRIFTLAEANQRRQDVFAALQAAFKVDTDSVVQLYQAIINDGNSVNGAKPLAASVKEEK